VTDPNSSTSLTSLGLGMGGLFTLGGIAVGLRSYFFTVAGARIVAKARKQLFHSIIDQKIEFFDKSRTGDLLNRLANDVEVMAKALSGPNLSSGLRAIIQGVGCFALMTALSPPLMGVVIAVVPLIGGLGWVYGKFIKTMQEKIQAAQGIASQVAEESISSVRTVKAFAAESSENARYAKQVDQVLKRMEETALAGSLYFGLTQAVGYSSLLAVFIYGTHLHNTGQITVGDLTSFVLYTIYLGMSLVGGSNFYGEIMKGLGSGVRVFSIIDMERQATSGIKPEIHGDISIKNVCFAYPDRPEHEIFNNLSLKIASGQVVAIVGQSGSGKSSVANLLLRFFDPLSGSIEIDGVNINDMDLTWLRQNIGIVSQEPVLFSGTILENIKYGKHDASMEEVIEAAKEANAHDFISQFPDMYDTAVGERGSSLSGGQKQRIAIARALLKNPRILILDEATSALDNESERLVQEALDKLMKNRTTIVIAHRLSTIQGADIIAVLKDRHVVELGSHEELLSNPNGHFRHLVESK
jgi:ATP-binding cassette subfamily B (MDR/TAP) protein 10